MFPVVNSLTYRFPGRVERDTLRSLTAEIDAAVAAGRNGLGREPGRVRRNDKAGRGRRKAAAAGIGRTAGEVDWPPTRDRQVAVGHVHCGVGNALLARDRLR